LRENADVVGKYFRGKLEDLQSKYALIGDVRGMGLMQALELVKDRKDQRTGARSDQHGLWNALVIMVCLSAKAVSTATTLRLAPMLNTTKGDVDDAIQLLDKSFSEVR